MKFFRKQKQKTNPIFTVTCKVLVQALNSNAENNVLFALPNLNYASERRKS